MKPIQPRGILVLAVCATAATAAATIRLTGPVDLTPEPFGAYDGGIAVADFDGDGDPDIAAASGNQFAWWANPGPAGGDWGDTWLVYETASVWIARDLATSDMDRDGAPDLVVLDSVGEEVSWWANVAGDGSTWTTTATWTWWSPPPNWSGSRTGATPWAGGWG